MSTINIPRTVDEALASLDGIGRLVTAKEWERAALVYALTHEGRTGGRRSGTNVTLSFQGLADRGISGLADRKRVAWYHDQWQAVVEAGYAQPVGLGDDLDIPDDWEWPPNDTVGERDTTMTPERRDRLMEAGRAAGMRTGSKVVDIAANPRSMAEAIKADSATAEAAAKALAESRGLATEADPRVERMMRRAGKEREAWESSANRGEARGSEHETRAMLEIQWLNENGHRDSLVAIREYIDGLLDLEQAQNLTPEMFHE